MAAPITHIVLTEKIFQSLFPEKDYREFIVGTSLPDIRYLRVIEREKIHFSESRLDDIKNLDSFNSGLRFHSIVDRVRENYLLAHNLYDKCPKSKYITQSIKFLEDRDLYTHISNWDSYIKMFDTILDTEIQIGLKSTYINYWHNTLQEYFATQPNSQSIDAFVKRINLGQDVANEIKDNIDMISEINEVTDYISSLYVNFEELLQEKSSQRRS